MSGNAQKNDKKERLKNSDCFSAKCEKCESKLEKIHKSNIFNLCIEEELICENCGKTNKKSIYYIN